MKSLSRLAIIIAAAMALAGCGDSTPEVADNTQPAPGATVEQPGEPSETAKPQPGDPDYDPAEDEYGAPDYSEDDTGVPEGEWATIYQEYPEHGEVGEWEVRVTESFVTTSIPEVESEDVSLQDGKKWAVVKFEGANKSKRPASNSWEIYLIADNHDMFMGEFDDTYWLNTNNDIEGGKTINPGDTNAEYVVFQIPENLTPAQFVVGDIYMGTEQNAAVFELSPRIEGQ